MVSKMSRQSQNMYFDFQSSFHIWMRCSKEFQCVRKGLYFEECCYIRKRHCSVAHVYEGLSMSSCNCPGKKYLTSCQYMIYLSTIYETWSNWHQFCFSHRRSNAFRSVPGLRPSHISWWMKGVETRKMLRYEQHIIYLVRNNCHLREHLEQ